VDNCSPADNKCPTISGETWEPSKSGPSGVKTVRGTTIGPKPVAGMWGKLAVESVTTRTNFAFDAGDN